MKVLWAVPLVLTTVSFSPMQSKTDCQNCQTAAFSRYNCPAPRHVQLLEEL
jgi:hypothetical protein